MDRRAQLKQWLESGQAQLQPLTFPQREIWETSPVPVEDPANHICCLIEVRGLLTERDVRAAIQRVVDRQEALRLSFLPGKERPLQMIRKEGEENCVFRDIAPGTGGPEIEELAGEIFRKPFDLVQGPLYRVIDLRRSPNDHVLVFAIHHAIADGWSLGVFVEELFAAYIQSMMGSADALPPVPLPYSAWGASERAFWQPAALTERVEFWKTRLAGSKPIWSAPITRGAPQRWVSRIPAAVAKETQELARRLGVTLFSALLGTFRIAFAKWNGTDDLVVGTPVANRTRQGARESMGYFSGVVPLRGRVDRARTASDHLRTNHQMVIDSFANAMPFAELAPALGERPAPGYNPVFEVRFALQNHPIPEVSLPNMSAKLSMRSTGTARFQLACEITEDPEGPEVAWLFRYNLFSKRDIERLDGIFQDVLAGICRAPESPISELLN
ncbi:MAG: condensation domain-containing protein [Verrucomicrobiota bacterium]|nr:condensation domain-containing protein [Verrucomicrobiota bacterium]